MADPKQIPLQQSLHRIHVPAESPRMTQGDSFEGLKIPWPKGLEPQPQPMRRKPSPDDALPVVDIIAMMDTSAEAEAMCDVLTPGYYYDTEWYTYARKFKSYKPLFGPQAPANHAPYLGQYFLTKIGDWKVLVYKTNLHLHTDGKLIDGHYTMPIAKMLKQMIAEAKPKVFLTTGTSGGVYCSMQLGDVAVTRAAHFLCQDHYAKEPFNGKTYKSEWVVPQEYSAEAHKLMQGYANELTGKGDPPSKKCSCNPSKKYPTDIYFDGENHIPPFHPVLTTDFFDYGTSANQLDKIGVAVEMDDAVLGLVCSEMKRPPRWASVRNLSDPCINGSLDKSDQGNCANFYYDKYGYWTTVMSGITTWSIIAGYKK